MITLRIANVRSSLCPCSVYAALSTDACLRVVILYLQWQAIADRTIGVEDVKSMCERNKPDVLVCYFFIYLLLLVQPGLEALMTKDCKLDKTLADYLPSSVHRCGRKRRVTKFKG